MTTPVSTHSELAIVSKALQDVHKHLLAFQAEQIGFSGTPMQLFDLASKDSLFAWLKPLREGIVRLDERRAEADPISDAETRAFGEAFLDLLGSETGLPRDRIQGAFQASPETIWAVNSARTSLRALVA